MMEKNEIEKNNRLIAEFMEWPTGSEKYNQQNDYSMPIYLTENSKYPGATMTSVRGMKFHTSWDWLMPVVDKIEQTKNNDGYEYQVDIQNNHCKIEDSNVCGRSARIYSATKIEAVYAAVIQFITYHNNLKALNTIEDELPKQ